MRDYIRVLSASKGIKRRDVWKCVCVFVPFLFVLLMMALDLQTGVVRCSETQKSVWGFYRESGRGGSSSSSSGDASCPYLFAKAFVLTVSILKLLVSRTSDSIPFWEALAQLDVASVVETVKVNSTAPVRFNRFNINATRILN